MQGQKTKVKGSKKVPVTKVRVLTCENGRRVEVTPVVVQPTHAPVPPIARPAQVQNVTVTVRDPKDRSVKEDVTGVPVDILLPRLGNEVLVLPEREEDVGVQSDVSRLLQTLELLLAVDVGLTILEHRDVLDLGEVQLGERCGAGIRLFRDDAPALADELDRIETTTVDGDGLRLVIFIQRDNGFAIKHKKDVFEKS